MYALCEQYKKGKDLKALFVWSLIVVHFFIMPYAFAYEEEVLIFSYCSNRPDFIEWQYKTFNKFLYDNYKFIVFNDAPDGGKAAEIEATCYKYNISCIRVPQGGKSSAPGVRHQHSIGYSLNLLGFKHHGIVCMIDADMFLVKPFSITDFMKDCDISALPQTRPNQVLYLFPGLVFMDMRTLPNKEFICWTGEYINGSNTDTGGAMHYYLKNNPEVCVKFMDQLYFPPNVNSDRDKVICNSCKQAASIACTHTGELLKKHGLDCHAVSFLQKGPCGGNEFFISGHFYHYRGSSWDSSVNHIQKTRLVTLYMSDILNS